jgi:hypothetical protein
MGKVDWGIAKAWEDAVKTAAAKRPHAIQGIDKVADMDVMLRAIFGVLPRLQPPRVAVAGWDHGV